MPASLLRWIFWRLHLCWWAYEWTGRVSWSGAGWAGGVLGACDPAPPQRQGRDSPASLWSHRVMKRRAQCAPASMPSVSRLWCWICVVTADERSLTLACQYAKSSFIAFFNEACFVCTSGRLSQILLWGKEISPTLLLSLCFCVSAISRGKICPFLCVCKGIRQTYAKSTWTNILKSFCWEKLQGDYKTWMI